MSKFTLKDILYLSNDYVESTLIINDIEISDRTSNQYEIMNIFYKIDILDKSSKKLFENELFESLFKRNSRSLFEEARKFDIRVKDKIEIISKIIKKRTGKVRFTGEPEILEYYLDGEEREFKKYRRDYEIPVCPKRRLEPKDIPCRKKRTTFETYQDYIDYIKLIISKKNINK